MKANLWHSFGITSQAINTTIHLVNLSSIKANRRKTLEEKYNNKTPDVNDPKVFGCLAFVHIPKEASKMMDSKTVHCMFLGYNQQTKACRLYNPEKKKIIISRNLSFDEEKVRL